LLLQHEHGGLARKQARPKAATQRGSGGGRACAGKMIDLESRQRADAPALMRRRMHASEPLAAA